MHSDLIIVGGGPAGLAFALSLAGAGLRITVIETHPEEELANPPFDGRDIALTHGSKRILSELGIWERLPRDQVFPIRDARVLDGYSPYALEFGHQEAGVNALGFLVSNHLIRRTLYEAVSATEDVLLQTSQTVSSVHPEESSVTVTNCSGHSLKASLLVAADSRFSSVRRRVGVAARHRDFGRAALVCRMSHEHDNSGIASECFQYGQTVAVLPLTSQSSSIVITVPTDRAQTLLEMTTTDFAGWISARLDNQLGSMDLIGERFVYPLIAVLADRFDGPRTALIGDAAVGMHPVTAHGYNLGLSGQELLARAVLTARHQGQDIGSPRLLQQYSDRHRRVVLPMYFGTNALVGLYTTENLPTKIVRKALLHAANHLPPIRRVVTDRLVSH